MKTLKNTFIYAIAGLFAATAFAVMPVKTHAADLSFNQILGLIGSIDELRQSNSEQEIASYLQYIIEQLTNRINLQINNVSGPFDNNNSDRPDVDTDNADDVDDDSAELNGYVDMNDFRNGIVFFVWGEDEDEVEDVENEDQYSDVRERGNDLQKTRVDSDLDGDDDYQLDIRNLDDDTDYYFAICVEYDDEDNDETIRCGSVEDFETDHNNSNSNDDEPDVDTENALDIRDDSAELNGEVDMNDFGNGIVFFIWGEDEDLIKDAEDEDEFDDINEDGDDLQKEIVDFDLDNQDDYSLDVDGLDSDRDHYFTICIEYNDEDNDETIMCGEVLDFRTDD